MKVLDNLILGALFVSLLFGLLFAVFSIIYWGGQLLQ